MKQLLPLIFFAVILFSSCTRFSTPSGSRLQVSSSTTRTGGRNPTTSTTWYIAKDGEDRVKLNGRNLIERVNDNEKALRLARTYKVTRTMGIASFLGFFGGLTYGILGKEGKSTDLAKKVGLVCLPVLLITAPISSGKAKKAIKVYNEF